MQNYTYRKPIEITRHALQRLEERVVTYSGFKNWQHMVKTARYEGRSEVNMTEAEYKWYSTHISHLYNSSQVRIMNGFAFLFMGNKGHARTLVTVIAVAKN